MNNVIGKDSKQIKHLLTFVTMDSYIELVFSSKQQTL